MTEPENEDIPEAVPRRQVDSSQLPKGETAKDFDWVSIDPDDIPEEVLTCMCKYCSIFVIALITCSLFITEHIQMKVHSTK